jgi:glucosamine--fructose-6-phosphate aminotransferase (isomerizing)
VALHLLALMLGQARRSLAPDTARLLVRELDQLPLSIEGALALDSQIEEVSGWLQTRRDCLYLGRGINYPIALEGALKLKEISYIHAEGYPAGEMKHGPIALIEEELPVIVLAADDGLFEKVLGNIQEAKARGGRIIVVTQTSKARAFEGVLSADRDVVLNVPDAHPLLMPVLMTIPMQLLAYHVAVRRGCDVDQPRNLAKSVTVE